LNLKQFATDPDLAEGFFFVFSNKNDEAYI